MAKRKSKRMTRRTGRGKGKVTRRRRTTRGGKGLPVPHVDQSIGGFVGITLGRAVQVYIDVPFVAEQALGMYAYAWFVHRRNKAAGRCWASAAVAIQLDTIGQDSGFVPGLLSRLPGTGA